MTIYPDGQFSGTKTLWWKDDMRYRLGVPRQPNGTPAHDFLPWEVAQVGVGLSNRRPISRPKGECSIMMSVWSAHLLRISGHRT